MPSPLLVLGAGLGIEKANKAFYKRFHVSKKDIENKNFFELSSSSWDTVELRSLFEDLLKDKKNFYDYEMRVLFRRIGIRVILISATEIVRNEDQLILVSIEDITERREAERQKNDFIATASHELKTPITALKLFSQILEKKFAKGGDPKVSILISNMSAQLDALVRLVHSLLDLNEAERGQIVFHKKLFDLNALLERVVTNAELYSDKHRILLRGNRARMQVYGDEDRIEQVLINLIANAIKYSPAADKVICSLKLESKNIKVSIQDYGIGILSREQTRIFERYIRIDREKKPSISGFGLGLYISAEIIKAHGGKIHVKSARRRGSTFYFSLPRKKTNFKYEKIQKIT